MPPGVEARLPRRLGRHLDLEELLGERRLHVPHQVLEHLERFLLVLDERILLAVGPILDRVAQLIQIIQVVLPLFVEDCSA